jgi:hypothetical protein
MYDEMAINYFKGLSKEEKTNLMRKIVDSLTEEEKEELAKIIVGE